MSPKVSKKPGGSGKGLRVAIDGPPGPRFEEVLTEPALEFLAELHARFDPRRRELLAGRGEFRRQLSLGEPPSFPPETLAIREGSWRVPPPPKDLEDRRVEITGPTDRKMIINALNSGARVYMADFEDSLSPMWSVVVSGQVNLIDAVRGRITYQAPDGREYRVGPSPATLMVRPRGWHLEERHCRVASRPISASLFDFGLYAFHNARELLARGTGPYLYVPKIEHYLEARLWNEVLTTTEETLGLPPGSIRVTALIETLPAVFQMDEILWELRDHSVGLNCGRWDYLFSFIKQYRDDPHHLFPDRDRLVMSQPFLTAYSTLLVRTCHRRGAHAMGGMAADIPVRDSAQVTEEALARVREDKEREVRAGHDGTWVAHPGLVGVSREVFDRGMPGPNQIDRPLPPSPRVPDDLLRVPVGPVTAAGVRRNARVSVRYLSAWLDGMGCVPIDYKMEDAATAEIARAQLWQWVRLKAALAEGGRVDATRVRADLRAEAEALDRETDAPGSGPSSAQAVALLSRVVAQREFEEFITRAAYGLLADEPRRATS